MHGDTPGETPTCSLRADRVQRRSSRSARNGSGVALFITTCISLRDLSSLLASDIGGVPVFIDGETRCISVHIGSAVRFLSLG